MNHGRLTKIHYQHLEIWSVWAPTLGKGDQTRQDRRTQWDEELWKTLAQPTPTPRIVMGNFQAVLEDHHMNDSTAYWHAQRRNPNMLGLDDNMDIGTQGYPATTANERLALHEGLLEANLVDPQARRKPTNTQFTWRDPTLQHALVTTYTFVSSCIQQAGGGVEANTTIEPVNTKDPFLGSSNRPKWLSLKEDWKERIKLWKGRQRQDEKQAEGHEETKQWEEEEQTVNIAIVNNMFKNIDQRLVPKQYNHQESGEARDELEYIKPPIFEKEMEGEEIKPALFPDELWHLVDPNQRRRVKGRFDKFTDEEYLNSCVEKILNQLDILNRGEELVDWGKGEVKEQDSKIMKAQALANIDTYFFSNPRVAELARDVACTEPSTLASRLARSRGGILLHIS